MLHDVGRHVQAAVLVNSAHGCWRAGKPGQLGAMEESADPVLRAERFNDGAGEERGPSGQPVLAFWCALGPESHLATTLAVHIGVDAPGEEMDSAFRLRAQSDDALQLEVSQEMLGMLRCGVGDVHVTGLDTTGMGRGHCACWWRQCTLMEAIRVSWRTDRETGCLKHDGLHTTAQALSRRGAGARRMHGGRVRIRASKCARGGEVPGVGREDEQHENQRQGRARAAETWQPVAWRVAARAVVRLARCGARRHGDGPPGQNARARAMCPCRFRPGLKQGADYGNLLWWKWWQNLG